MSKMKKVVTIVLVCFVFTLGIIFQLQDPEKELAPEQTQTVEETQMSEQTMTQEQTQEPEQMQEQFQTREIEESVSKEQYYSSEEYEKEFFDQVIMELQQLAITHFRETGEKWSWVLKGLDNQKFKFYVVTLDTEAIYRKEIMDGPYTFLQMGGLIDAEIAEMAKEAFEEDELSAALYSLAESVRLEVWNMNTYYDYYKSQNLPIDWKIEELDTDFYMLQVAVGQYVGEDISYFPTGELFFIIEEE